MGERLMMMERDVIGKRSVPVLASLRTVSVDALVSVPFPSQILGNIERMISRIFVYGTLQQGQCRAAMWPVLPNNVTRSWTLGTLFGRDDYPAMIEGDDRVLGECWQFDPSAMDKVLAALDIIEGANQPGRPDLYVRREVDVWALSDDSSQPSTVPKRAWTYHYATDPHHDRFEAITPSQDGYVGWP